MEEFIMRECVMELYILHFTGQGYEIRHMIARKSNRETIR